MILHSFGGGVFADVAFRRDRVLVAFREGDPRQPGRIRVVEFPTDALVQPDHTLAVQPTLLYTAELPPGSPAFPRVAVVDDLVWLVYHDGLNLQLRQLESGRTVTLAGFGNSPAVFGHGWLAWQATSAYRVDLLGLRGGEVLQGHRTGAPTGLSRITETGGVITVDEDRHALAGSTIPCFAGDLAVGEGPTGGAVWQLGTQRGLLWPGRDCFTPRCARSNTHTAVVTFGPDVRIFVGTPAELATFVPPIDPPIEPPTDPTDPPIDPEPVRMVMPDNVYATIAAFYEKFGLPAGEEAQRAHHGRCCQTVKARHFGRWGWKRADAGRPPSLDAIAFNGDRLFIWDCVVDAGGPNRRFSLQPGAEGQDATGQVFIDVEPHDWLAGVEPDPDPDPLPDVDAKLAALRTELLAEIATVRGIAHGAVATGDRLEARVATLEQKPSAPFDPTQYDVKVDVGRSWSHSHSASGTLVKKQVQQ